MMLSDIDRTLVRRVRPDAAAIPGLERPAEFLAVRDMRLLPSVLWRSGEPALRAVVSKAMRGAERLPRLRGAEAPGPAAPSLPVRRP